MVQRLILAVPRGCLQFVIVVFPDHTHLLFFNYVLVVGTLKYALTHTSLASFLWDKGKQFRPRSDITERSVWSGSPLFAYSMIY